MKRWFVTFVAAAAVCMMLTAEPCSAEDPILIGVPTSLTAIEGKESLMAVEMAVEEINAKGGVKVGPALRTLKIVPADLRDSSAGVPVQEALLGLEKIIIDQKVNAIVVGPFRSEALLAGMDLLAKYKVPMLGTIAMSPKSEEQVKEKPEYRYCFRVCLNGKYLVGYLAQTMGFLNKEFGFKKFYAMHQDVDWARGTVAGTTKVAASAFGCENVGTEAYPTGSSIFHRAS